jgi:SAM-dependent methyltransferase
MIKMYHPGALASGEPGFWDDSWRTGSLAEALRFCEQDPLRPLFERYAPPGSLLLEGGCGLGQYVVFYGRRGRRVVGLDFAPTALWQLKGAEPTSKLCRGDVAALPFTDESFDVYYSGGVVEHFEAGPRRALEEAWRVLRADGRFLVSVPFASPLRRAKIALGCSPTTWAARPAGHFLGEDRRGQAFWQYAFSRREFTGLLAEAGFRVLEVLPYSVLFGLYELPGLAWLTRVATGHSSSGASCTPPEGGIENQGPPLTQPAARGLRSVLRRLVVREDRTVPILGTGVSACASLGANMLMFVCSKESRASGGKL